jgi:hypothetical protein
MTGGRPAPALPTDVALRCECGRVHGIAEGVTPAASCRVVCYCDDCQAFARFLGRPGIVDAWGGTDVLQIAPNQVRIDDPERALRCLRLSARGLYRWYCGECRTPIGNALDARVPFLSLIHCFMAPRGDELSRTDLFGDPYYSQGEFAKPGLPAERQGVPFGAIGKSVRLLGKWWLSGAASPSPFFGTGCEPRVPPQVLTAAQRLAL